MTIEKSEQEKIDHDLFMTGSAFSVGGKHVPVEDVTVHYRELDELDEELIENAWQMHKVAKPCNHNWVSADNEYVSGCDICTECKTIRTRPIIGEST